MALVLLFAIVIVSIITHQFVIELPIDTFMALAVPQWSFGAILLLLLSWLLDDEPRSL